MSLSDYNGPKSVIRLADDEIRSAANEIIDGGHNEQLSQWARIAVILLDELERTEARLDECRKARREGY